jgi:hypothetical protein
MCGRLACRERSYSKRIFMGQLTPDQPFRESHADYSIWRKSLAIGLIAAFPPWTVNAFVTAWILRTGGVGSGFTDWLVEFLSPPLVLEPIVAVFLDVVTILALSAHARFRADRWWLAGALFVLNASLVTSAIEAPSSGDGFVFRIVLSAFTGYWILVFAAGALAWRRMTPTYVPEQWLDPLDLAEE